MLLGRCAVPATGCGVRGATAGCAPHWPTLSARAPRGHNAPSIAPALLRQTRSPQHAQPRSQLQRKASRASLKAAAMSRRKLFSRYVLVVDNLSDSTRTKDVGYEFEAAGKVRDVARDYKARCALVEYSSSSDAKYAWRKMDGFKMDGRRWRVDWASSDDFDMFGWKWFEGGRSPSPPRGRSRSRSRSRSPPLTPHDQDRKTDGGRSASPATRPSSGSSPAGRHDD